MDRRRILETIPIEEAGACGKACQPPSHCQRHSMIHTSLSLYQPRCSENARTQPLSTLQHLRYPCPPMRPPRGSKVASCPDVCNQASKLLSTGLEHNILIVENGYARSESLVHPECVGYDSFTILTDQSSSSKLYGNPLPGSSEIAFSSLAAGPSARFHSNTTKITDIVITETSQSTSSAIALYNSSFDVGSPTMNTAISAPGSPPELSGSRSSKSSSYGSSLHSSNPDGIASDITNFEEIGLDDDQSPYDKLSELPSRSSTVNLPGTSSRQKRPNTYLEKRQTFPRLQSQVRAAAQNQETGLKRKDKNGTLGLFPGGFTSSPAGLGSPFHNSRPRSSSPPRKSTSFGNGSLSATTLHSSSNQLRSSQTFPPRRRSWQPTQQRKSVRELEDEYHNSDDELPDDASLWNVPISPFIGDRSARSSFHGSPDRRINAAAAVNPRPIPLAHAKTAPDVLDRSNNFSKSVPQGRPHHRITPIHKSTSNPSSPNHRSLHPTRSRSWNFAMDDLSEEAKIITEALEHHSNETESKGIESRENSPSGTRLNSILKHKSSGAIIQLPPIQTGSLDFMPISKEKEAILSRTRPSWLPPKDPKEEKKHLKEYQQMMAASMEAEKKRRNKVQTQQCEKDDTRDALDRVWQYYCLDTTDLTTIDKRVYDLCWRGISPKARAKVWQRAVGNGLGLTVQSYDKALARSKDIQSRIKSHLSEQEKQMCEWFKDIERDAETAFPELRLFQRDGPMWQDLVNVCEAYACYRSDIGYVYGVQLIGALVLLQVSSPAEAFILLANCLHRTVPFAFQSGDPAVTSRTYNHAISSLAIKFPRLHEYLFGSMEQGGLGFTGEEIFEPMFRTVFANGLDAERLSRVWDIWVFEGDRTLVQTSVALLGSIQFQLFDIRGDMDLKRRNIQEMLGWGPFNRNDQGSYWDLQALGNVDKFIEEIEAAGTLNYLGK